MIMACSESSPPSPSVADDGGGGTGPIGGPPPGSGSSESGRSSESGGSSGNEPSDSLDSGGNSEIEVPRASEGGAGMAPGDDPPISGAAHGGRQGDGGGGQHEQLAPGGQAGEGGAPTEDPLPAGASCLACGAAACGSTLQRCEQNPECSPWLTCLRGCDTRSCVDTCDSSHAAVARVFYGVYACLCGSCDSSCQLAASCEKRCTDNDGLPPSSSAPATLAETGLYTSEGAISPVVYPYDVRFPLWADGSGKGRYIYVPRCANIRTEDMDHWEFPIGTRLWKHFSVGDAVVETRLLHRYGSAPTDWSFATYGWNPKSPGDPRQATRVLHGQPNTAGTLHDIPDPSACPSCHGKLPDKPLGFSAFQLSHSGPGLNMQRLSDWGWLSVPARAGFQVPGTAVQQAALGYLHGNCGGCHNGSADIPRENPMRLRLLVSQTSFAATDTVRTTIGVPTVNAYAELQGKPRIDPQSRETSSIFLRMRDRNKFPMPPLASKFADSAGGVAEIGAFIDALPK